MLNRRITEVRGLPMYISGCHCLTKIKSTSINCVPAIKCKLQKPRSFRISVDMLRLVTIKSLSLYLFLVLCLNQLNLNIQFYKNISTLKSGEYTTVIEQKL